MAYDEDFQASLPRSGRMDGIDLQIVEIGDGGEVTISDGERSAVYTPMEGEPLSPERLRIFPAYVEAGQIRQAMAIENNAYLTVMSDAVTPLLAQLMVGALSRWYDEHEEE